MITQHSTLKLLYGFEPCFVKQKKGYYKKFESIFDVTVGIFGRIFKDEKAILFQKNEFWRQFSQQIWSYDDFTFTVAPAAASLIVGAYRYKIWYSPFQIYKLLISSVLLPYAPGDIKSQKSNKQIRGIADMFKKKWFDEQFNYFEKRGEFKGLSKVNNLDIIDYQFYKLLLKCTEKGEWTEEAWHYHCNMLVTCDMYHDNIVSIMQHEMLHILWEHLVRVGDRDPGLYNIATDYSINQQLKFTPELKKLLITNSNPDFFDKFVAGISLWRANVSNEDEKILKSFGLNRSSSFDELSEKINELANAFVYTSSVGVGLYRIRTNLKYQGRDSDFYYDILDYVKNELNNNGTIDDHTMWEKNDAEQKKERGNSISDKEEVKKVNELGNEQYLEENNDEKKIDNAEDNDVIEFGNKDRRNIKGGYEHPGFKNIVGKQEAKNAFKNAAQKSGYEPDDPEDLERALNDIPGLSSLRNMFHDWFSVKTKNWRKELRHFLKYCANPTELEYTMLREHRAIDNTFPGKKREMGFEVILGLDTSGSISGIDFNDFMGQMHKMSKDCDFDKVRIIQCHSRIADDRVYKIRKAKNIREFKIVETGGTKMQPIFEKLKRERNKKPLILFTDGHIEHFDANLYKSFKHIIFLSRGNSNRKTILENNGFNVICQDDEVNLAS